MPDFTSSELQIIKAAMTQVFQNKGNVQPELNKTPVTAPVLLANQTAKVEELKAGSGDACVGTRIWYSVADVTTVPEISSTVVNSSCDLTEGTGLSTAHVDYDFNVFLKQVIELNDKDCNNLFKFPERVAELLLHKQSLMVQAFNNHVISELEANKTTATTSELVDNVAVVANDYTITGAEYWTGDKVQETIAIFDQLADKHGLGEYLVICGRSLKVAATIASFNGGNVGTTEDGASVAFSRSQLFWDTRNLDTVVGAEVVYLVDPRAYASYFYAEYPEQGEELGDDKQTVVFSLPLQYYNNFAQDNTNVSTLEFAEMGALMPAKIDVRYQKKCDATTSKYGKPSLKHFWELDLVALFELAPNDGANTGIVKVVKA